MKLQSEPLLVSSKLNLPQRILLKIAACREEEEEYAADELVELAEEILHQIAAIGYLHYLNQEPQREVYNDFLIQLFNSSGHDYNAGPLYRWAANMVKENADLQRSGHYRFFWQEKNGEIVLSEDVHHLAGLRNQVMHGFFVLPPEKNREEADKIGRLLKELHDHDFFKTSMKLHFIDEGGFTGSWNIKEDEQWNAYISDTSFGQLCRRIVEEQSDQFWIKEAAVFEKAEDGLVPVELKNFIQANEKGAFACWIHPTDFEAPKRYGAIGNWISSQPGIRFIGYKLHEKGVSYSGSFLLNRLIHVLNEKKIPLSKNKKPEELVKDLRKEATGKLVVLIDQIHLALFSPQHVSRLNNFLFDNRILLVAIGHHYEHFNTFFNKTYNIEYPSSLPDKKEQKGILNNYLRFKGPSIDKSDERDDVLKLEEIMEKVVDELKNGKEVYARRFADEQCYDIEYVHEIFAVLHPWVKSSRKPFEADTVDELYGFPTIMTEVTPIYLALGRRDLKLEYQHKTLYIQ